MPGPRTVSHPPAVRVWTRRGGGGGRTEGQRGAEAEHLEDEPADVRRRRCVGEDREAPGCRWRVGRGEDAVELGLRGALDGRVRGEEGEEGLDEGEGLRVGLVGARRERSAVTHAVHCACWGRVSPCWGRCV